MSAVVERGFLLPVRNGTAIFRWDGSALRECAGTFSTTEYHGWFGSLATDTDIRVRRASNTHPNAARFAFEQWRGAFDGEPSLVREVAIPTSLGYSTPHCALKDNVLVVGGTLDQGRLVSLDLEDPTERWRCLLPTADPDERWPHNTVRAVCIDRDRLLCVDTKFGSDDPRWTVFDVGNPRDVYPGKTVAIEPNPAASRNGEYVEQVIVSGPFVIAQTRSQFTDGWNYWLRFFERDSLRALGEWAHDYLTSWKFADADSIAGCDELLAVCGRRSGVRLFDVRAIELGRGGSGTTANAVRRIDRAGYEPTRARFCDPSRLVVVWQAPDGSYDVTLETL